MAINVYLMPAITRDSPDRPGVMERLPKYRDEYAGQAPDFVILYGAEDAALVALQDVPAGVHATLAGHADCTAVPDLSQTVGGQLATVQARIEALKLPAQWVQSSDSYGSVVRVVAIVFLLMERFKGLGKEKIFQAGITLDTRFNQLPVGVRQDLRDLGDSFGFDTSAVAGTSTLRQILKMMADQWGLLTIHTGFGSI